MEELKSAPRMAQPTIKGLDFFIMATLTLIFVLCPLFFTGLVAQNIGFEKMILFYFLVLLGIVAWVTKGVITGELNFKRSPLDWPIVALLITFVISTILSISQKDSLLGSYGNSAKSLAAVVVYILFFILLINNINVKRIKILFWSLITSTFFVSLYSILQLFKIYVLPLAFTKAASFNPIGSLSGLTMYLVVMLPLLTIGVSLLNIIHPNLKNKLATLAIKIALGVNILLTLIILTLLNGFTFWPVAIVGTVIILMFLLSKVTKSHTGNLTVPIVLFLVLIILLVLGNFNIINLNLPAEVSLSRSASWDIAKANIAHDPIFGSGPSTFYYSFAKFKNADFNNTLLWNVRFDNASGVIFELLANVGILGTLAFIVIFLIAISICFLSLIKNIKNELQGILLALFASFISIIIYSLLFTLNNAVVLIFMMVTTLTVAIAIVLYPERFKTLNLSFRASPKFALALAAIFLTVSAGVVILFTLGIKMFLADIYAKKSIDAPAISQKINYLSQAIQLAPYQDIYYINLSNLYMQQANNTALTNQADIETNLSLSIDAGKKAVALAPNSAADNEALALIYENASFYVRGALEWAEALYNKVKELDPDSPAADIRLALIDMVRANSETDKTEQANYINEAIKKYDMAIAKKADLGAAYYGKAIALERLNQNNDAIEQLKRAVVLTQNNVDYRFELGRMIFNRGISPANLAQNAAEDITKGEGNDQELSVNPTGGGTVRRNDDLNTAEQLFLSILSANPNHANALYSLALLYQKIGENSNARPLVQKLMEILTTDQEKQIVQNQFPGLY